MATKAIVPERPIQNQCGKCGYRYKTWWSPSNTWEDNTNLRVCMRCGQHAAEKVEKDEQYWFYKSKRQTVAYRQLQRCYEAELQRAATRFAQSRIDKIHENRMREELIAAKRALADWRHSAAIERFSLWTLGVMVGFIVGLSTFRWLFNG